MTPNDKGYGSSQDGAARPRHARHAATPRQQPAGRQEAERRQGAARDAGAPRQQQDAYRREQRRQAQARPSYRQPAEAADGHQPVQAANGRQPARQASQRQAAPAHHASQGQAHAASNAWGEADRYRNAQHHADEQASAAILANSVDVDPMEQAAPRPVLDPAATGSFRRIDPSEGAVVTNRSNVEETSNFSAAAIEAEQMKLRGQARPNVRSHQTKVRMSRPVLVGVIVAAALVVVLVAFLVVRAVNSARDAGQDQPVEQTQVAADQSIDYRGTTFSLQQQDDGKYGLVSTPTDQATGAEGDSTVYFEFDGTPVQLVLYNGALIIPENLDGSWDVLAYTMGAGGLPTQVVDQDGNPITGNGQIASVELQDSNLLVTDDGGNVTTVPLA